MSLGKYRNGILPRHSAGKHAGWNKLHTVTALHASDLRIAGTAWSFFLLTQRLNYGVTN
jgi:hypothetical protein